MTRESEESDLSLHADPPDVFSSPMGLPVTRSIVTASDKRNESSSITLIRADRRDASRRLIEETALRHMEEETTYQLTVHGEVQRVGYRRQVERIAQKMGITGYIKNQPDGAAKIVAQASEHRIQEFLQAIKIDEAPIHVEDIETKTVPGRKGYRVFRIMPGSLIEELQEGLGSGEEQLRLMRREMREVRNEIRSGFTTMDKKYGEISETLKEVRSDFKRLVTAIEEFLRERSRPS